MDGGAAPAAPTAPKAPAGVGHRGRYLRQFELVERVRAYDPGADEALINRAYVYATAMHGSQKRLSGDPYFAHPIEVAGLLTEYKLDTATIVAGLLHDTIEDTEATREKIAELFGEQIADLVEGVTKLSKLDLDPEANPQAANLQKFILAMSKDVRVLLVKLADRLHNMKTLQFHPSADKRRRIALETLDIYAPLARRIGMDRMSRELESLAFAEAYPDAHQTILDRIEQLRTEKGANVATVTLAIKDLLAKAMPSARVMGREKQPHSIWRKLKRKAIDFADLADVYAFRIIVPSVDDCYRALGLLHQTWLSVPDGFEDYISNPKPNGYRSIHTLIIGPGNVRVEVQIRTEEMDHIAEEGVAAHWRYKNETYGFDAEAAQRAGLDAREAVRSLLEIAAHPDAGGEEFLEHARLEMYQDHVFAFTPKGRLIALPVGAGPLDFAYAVHSDVGDTCVGARINGVERPLRTVLRNGDVVDILRSDTAAPVPGWQAITKTGRAKSLQRRLERAAKREQFMRLGRDLLDHALHRVGHTYADTNLDDAVARLRLEGVEDLLVAVGDGSLTAAAAVAAAFPGLGAAAEAQAGRAPLRADKAHLYVDGSGLTPGVGLHLAECCSPVPGDRIIGVMRPGLGVEVHTIECHRLAQLEEEDLAWLDLSWTQNALKHSLAVARIQATVENGRGVLAHLCKLISDYQGDILNVRTRRDGQDFFDILFDLEVNDAQHLTNILAAMRSYKAVREADRARG